MFLPISEKTLLKWNKELVDLHKKVITSYLISSGISCSTRKKVFILYNYYINEKNIRSYFYVPTKVLLRALVLDKLNNVSTLINNNNVTRRKRKSSINKR